MEKTIKIELSEKELAKVLSEHYGFDPEKTNVNIYKHEADRPYESSYSTITITAPFNKNLNIDK